LDVAGTGDAVASAFVETVDVPGGPSLALLAWPALLVVHPGAVLDDRRVLTPVDLSLSPPCAGPDGTAAPLACDFFAAAPS
jgi:hypothetical protein